MSEETEKKNIEVTVSKGSVKEIKFDGKNKKTIHDFKIGDPVKDIDLGDDIYQVQAHQAQKTEPELQDPNLVYYTVTAIRVIGKEFTDSTKEYVKFKGENGVSAKIAVNPAKRELIDDTADLWLTDRDVALEVAEMLMKNALAYAQKQKKLYDKAVTLLETNIRENRY